MSKNKTYRFICILDEPSDYLHIHILNNSYLEPLEKFSAAISPQRKNNFLYQWGALADLKNKNRSPKVSAAEIKKLGQIGIGSLWQGVEQNGGSGGGEGFLFNQENFRIIKGNEVLQVSDEEKYWTFQVADFGGAKKFSTTKKISGRENLKKLLLEESSQKGCVATFDAEFCDDFFARSNGVFPWDKIENPAQSFFENNIKGGHLIGGSANSGDLKSLQLKFNKDDALKIDFAFKISGTALLKSHDEVVVLEAPMLG